MLLFVTKFASNRKMIFKRIKGSDEKDFLGAWTMAASYRKIFYVIIIIIIQFGVNFSMDQGSTN
jgi:hypothetical protein